jgi:hypothetical protein
MPGNGRDAQTHAQQGHVKPRLVAEPVEPEDPPPTLFPVQSYGRGLQLC